MMPHEHGPQLRRPKYAAYCTPPGRAPTAMHKPCIIGCQQQQQQRRQGFEAAAGSKLAAGVHAGALMEWIHEMAKPCPGLDVHPP